MKGIRNKKGFELTVGTIVVMVIGVIILLILLSQIGGLPAIFSGLRTCQDRGGHCQEEICGTGDYELMGVTKGCEVGERCCAPVESKEGTGKEGTASLSKDERAALQNAIFLAINKDNTPIPSSKPIELKVGLNYSFNFKMNDKLPAPYKEDAICAIYITDSKEVGSKYLFSKSDSEYSALVPGQVMPSELEIMKCSELGSKKFSPQPTDVFKSLNLYVIMFDSNLSKYAAAPSTSMKDFIESYSNPSHWAYYRTNKLEIKPLVQITGLNTEWSDKDEITISCTDINCENIGLKLVRLEGTEEKFDYNALYRDCQQPEGFVYQIDTITSVTSKTTGIPLIPALNIGGFRIPTQKEQVLYLTERKPVTVIKNKASITLDKASMIKNFYQTSQNPELFLGDKTYLCAKATLSDRTEVFTVSDRPLKIDILPPRVDQENGIQIIYPDPQYGDGARTTPYYYRQYPRVVVQCDDYGQSGCSQYDYYIKTGNFIDLNIQTDDLGTAIGATVLTQGLNALLGHFAEKDALNTICPFILSNEYRPNSFPEIRFSGDGQGIICVRVADKAGNQVIVWKSLWTPKQMFENILANATSALMNDLTS